MVKEKRERARYESERSVKAIMLLSTGAEACRMLQSG